MIEIKNRNLFGKVIASALVKVDTNTTLQTWEKARWLNAISKAAARIENSGSFMTWQPENGTLLIWSDSNEIYEANGVCQCKAFEHGYACWHRAAKKLIENYLKELEASQKTLSSFDEMRNAPYLKPSSNKVPEKVGSIRI